MSLGDIITYCILVLGNILAIAHDIKRKHIRMIKLYIRSVIMQLMNSKCIKKMENLKSKPLFITLSYVKN